MRCIPDEIPISLDGKFGEVGHSCEAYARAAYEAYRADAVTLSPNPDRATLTAFLSQANMATFVPARSPQPIDTLVSHAKTWSQSLPGTCGVIVEAGKLARVRSSAPDMPVLITSFNALKDEITPVAKYGPTPNGMGPIVDAGSSILYASSRDDFAEAAHVAARAWRDRLNAQSSVERDSARA